MAGMPRDERLIEDAPGFSGLVSRGRRRVSEGDLGPLPVIIGLVLIAIVFQLKNGRFLSADNITNLFLQVTAVGMVSVGIVLVLLLGEIDLSVGAVAGLAAAVVAVASVNHHLNPTLAILLALAVGLVIGLFNGIMITRFHVPSFVVTLAGLLGFQGVLLKVLGSQGTVNLPDNTAITNLVGTFFGTAVAAAIGVIVVAAYAAGLILNRRSRLAAGLPVPALQTIVLKILVVAIPTLVLIAIFSRSQGLPLAVVIWVGLIVVIDFVLRRTRFGRYVFAVGGNAEAARRAGIKVERVRIAVFALASTFAAFGGILAAARLFAANQSLGSGDFLLDAIAGAVIGGTSLFGGRGSAWSALLGALVIGSISNGMDLIALSSDYKYMITGAVLLLAVTIDAVARQGRRAAGRA
jgi:D-xylose transport system permease protein